jgi:hypothetical protein
LRLPLAAHAIEISNIDRADASMPYIDAGLGTVFFEDAGRDGCGSHTDPEG